MPADRGETARAFLKQAGWGDAVLTPLPGDASTRHYLRAEQGGRIAMLMDQPPGIETPACPPDASEEERRALGYNAIARLAGPDCGRFVATATYLRDRGLSAPEIYAADTEQGFILLEDLGNAVYGELIAAGGNEPELYGAAIDTLARLHAEAAPSALEGGMPLYNYDEVALLAEVELATEWFFPVGLGRMADEEEVLEHRQLWRHTLAMISEQPSVFVLRDYHSPNLLWLPNRNGIARVGVIDFQDAVSGPRSYDIISLIQDARRDVVPALADALAQRYVEAMQAQGSPLDTERHSAEMAIMAAQRNAKLVGIFARLYKRDRKSRYLAHLPRIWRYLERDLEHPALAPLKAWYDRAIPAEQRGVPRTEGATS